jgi:hypothetical protein
MSGGEREGAENSQIGSVRRNSDERMGYSRSTQSNVQDPQEHPRWCVFGATQDADPELLQLLKAWPKLPRHIRKAMLALAQVSE